LTWMAAMARSVWVIGWVEWRGARMVRRKVVLSACGMVPNSDPQRDVRKAIEMAWWMVHGLVVTMVPRTWWVLAKVVRKVPSMVLLMARQWDLRKDVAMWTESWKVSLKALTMAVMMAFEKGPRTG